MNKRRLVIVMVGVIVLAGCFYLLASSLRQLPPNSVKPNAKPGLAQPSNVKSSLAVSTKPVAGAQVIVAKSQAKSADTKPADCGQTPIANSGTASALTGPSSQLMPPGTSSVLSPKKTIETTLAAGQQLQNSLLNIASSLGQQIYQPDN